MGNLVADGSPPTLTFDDQSGGGVDWRIRLDPDDELHVQRDTGGATYETVARYTNTQVELQRMVSVKTSQPTILFDNTSGGSTDFRMIADDAVFAVQGGSSFGSIMEFTTTGIISRQSITVSNAEPTLTFEDSTSGDDDFRLRVDADTLHIETASAGSFSAVVDFVANAVIARQNVTVSNAEPTLTFEDSTSGDDDFRLRANGDTLFLESSSGGGYASVIDFSSDRVVARQNVTVSNAEPTLTLEDSTSGDDDFRLRANGDTLFLESSSGGAYASVIEFSATGMIGRQKLTLAGSVPTITFDASSGSYDYTVASDGTAFQVHRITAGVPDEVIGTKDRLLFAAGGIVAGHPTLDGSPEAFCVKRYAHLLTSDDVTNGYCQQYLSEVAKPWSEKTLGVIVMMSDSATSTSTYQVSSWCTGSASGNFSVQVLYGQGASPLPPRDLVKVTFDTSFYGAGDRWTLIAFYEPT